MLPIAAPHHVAELVAVNRTLDAVHAMDRPIHAPAPFTPAGNSPILFSSDHDLPASTPFFADDQLQTENNGMRILIVEDEALVALDMAMILQAAGYHIIGTKPTGDSALAALKAAEAENLLPDLILMDIALRGALDGIETTKQIKTSYAGIPIVFVTGQADPATRTRAETTQPAGYLLKPFTPEQLVGFINAILTR